MQRAAIRSIPLLLFALPAFARAAPPPSYAMEQWSQPYTCEAQHQRYLADPEQDSSVPAHVMMQRYLGVLDAVIAGDEAALTLRHLCDRFDLDFFPGMLPPPYAEPWNPSPRPPVGNVFAAFVDAAGMAFTQEVEAKYLPDRASLSLSISSKEDAPVAAGSGLGYRYRDMGDACPLRLGQLADRLAAAGFSKEYFAVEPPPPQYADTDFGVGASFQRDKLAVGATLQGTFAAQRTHPEAACVAGITLSLEK
ncbi:hypothetical protein [Xanthomonas sp. LMG 12459]|nr:hypothetical protein [Xanthomonas sp. LMG 12459]KAB7780752.1 hypothetical protein CEK65_02590 [Xanthomonas sp. LMG 12459]